MKRLPVACVLSWAVALPAVAVLAATPRPPLPRGFGKAKFGMSVAQVRRLYPALQPAQGGGAAYFNSPHLTRYLIPRVNVTGLKQRVNVELRFWKDQLWTVIVYYGTNPFEEVVQSLSRQYGQATTRGNDPSWEDSHTTIITAPGQAWYSFSDNAISKDPQEVLRNLLEALQGRRPAPQPGSALPGSGIHGSPTPAAPAP